MVINGSSVLRWLWRSSRMLILVGMVGLGMIGLGMTIAPLPAQADVQVSARLRDQVLQIIRDNPEAILESVQAYQQQQQAELRQAQQTFLDQVETNPATVIGQSPMTSDPTSKLLLVEFSDFQCPYCAQAHDVLKQFVEQHRNQVVLVYKHFPLVQIHAEALPAAKAAWAAGQQGKFWEYHDALFAQQAQLGESLYGTIAQKLGLDLDQFNRDRQSPQATQAIDQDVQLANSLGIDGTPFFIFNRKVLSGAVTLSDLEKILTPT